MKSDTIACEKSLRISHLHLIRELPLMNFLEL